MKENQLPGREWSRELMPNLCRYYSVSSCSRWKKHLKFIGNLFQSKNTRDLGDDSGEGRPSLMSRRRRNFQRNSTISLRGDQRSTWRMNLRETSRAFVHEIVSKKQKTSIFTSFDGFSGNDNAQLHTIESP